MLEITKMLTISTAHINYDTATILDAAATHEQIEAIIVYTKGEYGWIIYIDPEALETTRKNIPVDLLVCIDFALANDCTVLCLDADANEVAELPLYEWD